MNPERKNIERAAADWLARSEGGLSPLDETRLAAWLEADARHAETFRALQGSWSRLDHLRGSAAAARLEQELVTVAPPARRPRPRLILGPWISGALAAGLVGLLLYFAWWRPVQANAPFARTVVTEIGGGRTFALPDGSQIRLNTDTAIDVLYSRTERRVRLGRGEAFFKIAKNRSRPFIVSASGVDVRAVGTEFNVRVHSAALEVIVREGKVRVDTGTGGETLLVPPGAKGEGVVPAAEADPASREILAAGQRVVIPVVAADQPAVRPAVPVPLATVEIERALAWQNGRLVFESAPLAAIIAEFNRYNRRQLRIDDAALAAHAFGGTFVANDPDTFVELLRASYDVAADKRGDEIVLRRK